MSFYGKVLSAGLLYLLVALVAGLQRLLLPERLGLGLSLDGLPSQCGGRPVPGCSLQGPPYLL